MSGGGLSTNLEIVGDSGVGSFTQTGGTNGNNQMLLVGNNPGSNGTYNLSGNGQLLGSYEAIGNGTFNQSGGTNNASFDLQVEAPNGGAVYNLSGSGMLSVSNVEIIGGFVISGTGTFNQSGGINLGYEVELGINTGTSGCYNLSGGSLFAPNQELIGESGLGVFTQTGGTNNASAAGSLFRLGLGGPGIYNLNGGLLILSSLSLYSGSASFNFSGGTLMAGGAFLSNMPMTLGTSGGGATFDTAGYAVTLSGSLSGPGSLTKVDSGTLTLAAANTFNGNTLLSAGTLALGSPLALQNSTLDTSGSGVMSFGALTAATLGGLAGPGTLALSNSATSAVVVSVGNNNASTTYSGALNGLGSLIKIGTGTLALTGSNTYTGPTTINQGMLVVDGSLVSPVTVDSGGVLGGTGYLTSGTVNSGGTIAPGDALGTLHFGGNLFLAPGAALQFGLDTPSTSDMVSCGTLVLSGQQFSDFQFTWTPNFGPETYPLIEFGSLGGTGLGTDYSGTIDGYAANLAISANELVLNVVAEPSTLALLGLGAAGLLGGAWRRRRSWQQVRTDGFRYPETRV